MLLLFSFASKHNQASEQNDCAFMSVLEVYTGPRRPSWLAQALADSKIIYERIIISRRYTSFLSPRSSPSFRWSPSRTRSQFHSACELRPRNFLGPRATQGLVLVMAAGSGRSTHGLLHGQLKCRLGGLGGCSLPGHATNVMECQAS